MLAGAEALAGAERAQGFGDGESPKGQSSRAELAHLSCRRGALHGLALTGSLVEVLREGATHCLAVDKLGGATRVGGPQD